MSRPPEFIDVETTGDMAKHIHRANRRTHAKIVIGIVVILGIVVFFFMVGRKACIDKQGLGVFEPPSSARKRVEDERDWVVHPDAMTARVNVVMSGPGPLMVDGQYAATVKSQTLELLPGAHIIAAHIRGAVVQQFLTVKAGEEFTVTFDEAAKDVRLDRIPPPKK